MSKKKRRNSVVFTEVEITPLHSEFQGTPSETVEKFHSSIRLAEAGAVSRQTVMAQLGIRYDATCREFSDSLAERWRTMFGEASRNYQVVNSHMPNAVPMIRMTAGGQIHDFITRMSDISRYFRETASPGIAGVIGSFMHHFSFQINAPRRCGKTLSAVRLVASGVPLIVVHRDSSMKSNFDSMLGRYMVERGMNPDPRRLPFESIVLGDVNGGRSPMLRLVHDMRRSSRERYDAVVFDEIGPGDVSERSMAVLIDAVTLSRSFIVPFIFMGTALRGFVDAPERSSSTGRGEDVLRLPGGGHCEHSDDGGRRQSRQRHAGSSASRRVRRHVDRQKGRRGGGKFCVRQCWHRISSRIHRRGIDAVERRRRWMDTPTIMKEER